MNFFDPTVLIQTVGLFGIIGVIFAESGIILGMFFPGDSLLFTAGILASQGLLPIAPLLIGTFIAAVLGDTVGYFFGRKIGPRIFIKQDSLFFNKGHIQKAQLFYEKHGKKTIIIARFVPIVRTLAPIIAGVGNMEYKTFIKYNVVGGFAWTFGVTLLGFLLGNIIPHIDTFLLPILILIVLISFVPGIIDLIRHYRRK